MPATSKSQQRLFCMALAVRKGELKRSEVSKAVLGIVDSKMTDKEIEDFTVLKEYHMKSLIDYIIEASNLTKKYIIIHTVDDDVLDYLDNRKDCYRVKINFGGTGLGQQDMDRDNFIIPNDNATIKKIKELLALHRDGMEVDTYLLPGGHISINDLIMALETSKICAIDLVRGESFSNY